MLYAACKPQADERGVSDEDFGRAMAGDAIEAATAALLEEIVAFCPSPRDRAALGRVLGAMHETRDKARDAVETRLDSMLDQKELDRIVGELMSEADGQAPPTSGGSSTGAPASSASTRPP